MDKIKAFIVFVSASFMARFSILAVPILLMVGCNVIDYITGIIASKYRNEPIDRYKGLRGIVKKVCMWILVLIGSWIDVLACYSLTQIDLDFNVKNIVATVVCLWIVFNEMISILENMNDIGVDIPPFLIPLVSRIKTSVEDTAEEKEE